MATTEPMPPGWHETARSIAFAELQPAARALAVALGVDDTDPAQLMREAAARLDDPVELAKRAHYVSTHGGYLWWPTPKTPARRAWERIKRMARR